MAGFQLSGDVAQEHLLLLLDGDREGDVLEGEDAVLRLAAERRVVAARAPQLKFDFLRRNVADRKIRRRVLGLHEERQTQQQNVEGRREAGARQTRALCDVAGARR
eukprot:scaffold146_cov265-Pinguiococcus_pyrenoidosus.AAC.6